ncbi:hypothetical protein VCUG_00249 [Vavraia culicis subsp. floridensis]|uniref:Uncharacterized protein n=1 Tax=Vavraia culicis (isolate floridensis) TaxID=948595 RepID=L2GY38_VAVCU|nr:uncharacterized protein VCUG_00249 [Vavraia culicis subsp. floridensis]ELA48208.1 hypothetical protein VCUG_00249 [Vavraia culicis subsp. floridensis]
MENTSSSDDNILETCVIDSSDLESAENETGGTQVCENNGAPYGKTDSLSRIDGGYESEKTDKNDDTFDENSEKCASDNEIGYYRDEDYNCEDRKYIERVRNDSDDADAVEMHSSPETVLNMKDHNRFNAEALKKNIDGSQHQEWLLMESCTRDPKKMENLPNTTSKSRNERKKERDKHEITNEDEQIDENNGRDAASVDKDGEKMKDSAEIAEEEKVIVNSDNNRDEDRDFEGNNETECGEEIADDDYEKSGENNNERFEAVNDVRSNDSENLDENNPEVAKESGKDVSFSLAQLIAAKNDDSNYDVMKHLNIIDPELQEGSKKMFIDDIVKGEQSKSILGKIEGELRENYEMEKKWRKRKK